MNELALFAGAGGGILGGKLLGWRTICAVERDAYAAQILAQRQNDGILKPFPIWSDITTFDGRPWRHIIDVVSGGFPCQDISVAGKGLGINGKRSKLWGEQKRIVCEVEPCHVYVENSPALTVRGLGVVIGDLAEMGFNAEWGVLSCRDVGGVHIRERIWIFATHPLRIGHVSEGITCELSYIKNRITKTCQCEKCEISNEFVPGYETSNNWSKRGERNKQKEVYRFTRFPWGEDVRGIDDLRNRSDLPQPLIRRISNDVAFGVDRLKAIGNGQVPRVAATAFNILSSKNRSKLTG